MSDIFYNKTVTVWTRATEGTWETETWTPHVLDNVRVLSSRGNNIEKSGLKDAASCRLHIMDGVSTAVDFTLQADDHSFFTVGDSSSVTAASENLFEELKQSYETYRIDSVDRFELIPHYEVWGK